MSSSTETASIFFALLSLLCVAGTLGVVVLVLVRRSRPDSSTAYFVDDLGRMALWLAWLVATVTTLGSLYYSEIADFVPCELCWFQRICMYPLVLILGVATWRRDRGVWVYVLPQAVVGAGIAIYHTQLQAFPDQATFCTTETPCTTRVVWEFHFVSLPFMALSAFTFIIAMVLLARATDPARWPDDGLEDDDAGDGEVGDDAGPREAGSDRAPSAEVGVR
ncbi:MAG: disulfide bond formation protein B [Acidimicrobiales bacterium]